MKQHHIELIYPHERYSPSLGGTGYLQPRQPSSKEELLLDAMSSEGYRQQMGVVIWKVARYSMRKIPIKVLNLFGKRIKCECVGTTTDWVFASVQIADVKRAFGD